MGTTSRHLERANTHDNLKRCPWTHVRLIFELAALNSSFHLRSSESSDQSDHVHRFCHLSLIKKKYVDVIPASAGRSQPNTFRFIHIHAGEIPYTSINHREIPHGTSTTCPKDRRPTFELHPAHPKPSYTTLHGTPSERDSSSVRAGSSSCFGEGWRLKQL